MDKKWPTERSSRPRSFCVSMNSAMSDGDGDDRYYHFQFPSLVWVRPVPHSVHGVGYLHMPLYDVTDRVVRYLPMTIAKRVNSHPHIAGGIRSCL